MEPGSAHNRWQRFTREGKEMRREERAQHVVYMRTDNPRKRVKREEPSHPRGSQQVAFTEHHLVGGNCWGCGSDQVARARRPNELPASKGMTANGGGIERRRFDPAQTDVILPPRLIPPRPTSFCIVQNQRRFSLTQAGVVLPCLGQGRKIERMAPQSTKEGSCLESGPRNNYGLKAWPKF
ncbi:unnamed protein product [Linum trigynum]|uniref:Uncharacterized protein n=1 Tax=Linum trigynum TaxID=586398 RepID=A0AAV2FRA9_9ROSI